MSCRYIITAILDCLVAAVLCISPVCASGTSNSSEVSSKLPATITLENRKIEIQTPGIDSRLMEAVTGTGQMPVQAVVLLTKKPSRKERAELRETGIVLLQYLGGTTYLAEFERKSKFDPYPPVVLWAGRLEPEDKLEKSLWSKQYEPWAVTKRGGIKVLVTFRKNVAQEKIQKLLDRFSISYSQHDGFRVWRAEITPGNIFKLAAEESVLWIEQGPHPSMPLDENR
jgi:hypothetical protein